MPTYITLIRFTQKGAEAIREGPARLDHQSELRLSYRQPEGRPGRKRHWPQKKREHRLHCGFLVIGTGELHGSYRLAGIRDQSERFAREGGGG